MALVFSVSPKENRKVIHRELDFKQLQRTDFKPTNDFFNVLTFLKKRIKLAYL